MKTKKLTSVERSFPSSIEAHVHCSAINMDISPPDINWNQKKFMQSTKPKQHTIISSMQIVMCIVRPPKIIIIIFHNSCVLINEQNVLSGAHNYKWHTGISGRSLAHCRLFVLILHQFSFLSLSLSTPTLSPNRLINCWAASRYAK